MAQCKRCDTDKDSSEFYPRDKTCKECRKAMVRANREKNVEHYREFDRQRANLPHRVHARQQYAGTEQGKARLNAGKRAYLERNPEKHAAHVTLLNAVRDRRVWKSPCCTAPGCFSDEGLHGHHTHYDNPLSVVWLCTPCHSELHREFNRKHAQVSIECSSAQH